MVTTFRVLRDLTVFLKV